MKPDGKFKLTRHFKSGHAMSFQQETGKENEKIKKAKQAFPFLVSAQEP